MRPDVLRYLPIAALAFSTACGNYDSEYPAPDSGSRPSSVDSRLLPRPYEFTPTPEFQNNTVAALASLNEMQRKLLDSYPELKGIPLKQLIKIAGLSQPATIYNYSPLRLNERALRDVFLYLDRLNVPQNSFGLKLSPGENIVLRPVARERSYFIVPTDAPNPEWGLGDEIITSRIDAKPVAFTNTDNNAAVIRFVSNDRLPEVSFYHSQLPIFQSSESFFQVLFLTEACQTSISVVKESPRSPLANQITAQGLDLEQELVCNGLAHAMLDRKSGRAYEVYERWINSVSHKLAESIVDPAVLPKDDYQALPEENLIFRS